jgi:hypothetical protein
VVSDSSPRHEGASVWAVGGLTFSDIESWETTLPLMATMTRRENPSLATTAEKLGRGYHSITPAKGVAVPSSADLIRIVTHDAERRSEWASMLAHQLPALPDLDALSRLPAVLGWLEAPSRPLPETRLPQVAMAAGYTPIVARGIQYWGASSPLETIRFAATNRLLLDFDYRRERRRVEPYSVRQAGTGNVLLAAWELAAGHIKNYKLDDMSGVTATNTAFSPRYQVEISALSHVRVYTATPRTRSLGQSDRRPRSARRGPTYVFQCPRCSKRFEHKTNDPILRAHKDKNGWNCSARRGFWIETQY